MADDLWLLPDTEGEEEARFIKKTLRLRKGQTVLDAPCGAGRIAFHLARAGCVVTCADLRRSFVNRARRRFREEGLDGDFCVVDLRHLDFDEEFDAAFNWGGSFGYFSDNENLEVIRRYARALKRGGRLLLEQVNREYILRNFLHERRTDTLIIRNRWDDIGKRIISRRIINGVSDPKDVSSMRCYTRSETERMLQRAGLIVEAFYSPNGEEFRRSSRRLIAVARKT